MTVVPCRANTFSSAAGEGYDYKIPLIAEMLHDAVSQREWLLSGMVDSFGCEPAARKGWEPPHVTGHAPNAT